jgi:transposase
MLKDKARELKQEKPLWLKKLGIDEIALVKGKGNYCAVLVDLETSKVIDILEERSQKKIIEVLSSWGKEVLEKIEYVSIDLWKPYQSLVKKLMPNAEVVADRFHVMKQVNEELDEQRKIKRGQRSLSNLSQNASIKRRISRNISATTKWIKRINKN